MDKIIFEITRQSLYDTYGTKGNLRAFAQHLNHERYSLTQVAKLTSDPEVLDDIAELPSQHLDYNAVVNDASFYFTHSRPFDLKKVNGCHFILLVILDYFST
ncbi:hypothetical protein ASG93_00840 [Paenibacillus sp. Soil787]|nr:hypothetical protein ASG93_00840 [Paenibacillus sp. Soil787]